MVETAAAATKGKAWLSIAPMTGEEVTRSKDGQAWRIGGPDEIAWIVNSVDGLSRSITAAIPPSFDAYATILLPGEPNIRFDVQQEHEQERALLRLFEAHAAPQSWWLGYLETGASDIVFWDAPKVPGYYQSWNYVLVNAGPEEALTWRPARERNWKALELPELIFPADRSWLMSTLWDDDWSCVGGSTSLIEALVADPVCGSRARRVGIEQDRTPPEFSES